MFIRQNRKSGAGPTVCEKGGMSVLRAFNWCCDRPDVYWCMYIGNESALFSGPS